MAAPTGDQERELDDVLAKIDQGLSKVHRKAKRATGKAGPAATRHFSPSRLKRTRMAFQAMCEDSLDEPEAIPETVVDLPATARQEIVRKAAESARNAAVGAPRINGATHT
jgi:hypothetical protein